MKENGTTKVGWEGQQNPYYKKKKILLSPLYVEKVQTSMYFHSESAINNFKDFDTYFLWSHHLGFEILILYDLKIRQKIPTFDAKAGGKGPRNFFPFHFFPVYLGVGLVEINLTFILHMNFFMKVYFSNNLHFGSWRISQ